MRSDDVRFAQNGTTNGTTEGRPWRQPVARFVGKTILAPVYCAAEDRASGDPHDANGLRGYWLRKNLLLLDFELRVVNCASLPFNVESRKVVELFGQARPGAWIGRPPFFNVYHLRSAGEVFLQDLTSDGPSS